MRPWERIGTAPVPDGDGTMRLMRRGHEFAIYVDNDELMRSTTHGSEDALAELTCGRLDARQDARVLVGGLGMGFTVAAALRCLGRDASVVVAEIVPAVVRWNRGELAHLAGRPLADPRVSLYEGDVARLIQDPPPARWDAILLDVDNGPAGLTRSANDGLYAAPGLKSAFRAIRPRGIFAVWSAGSDRAFVRRLRQAGFAVESFSLRARGPNGGRRHQIWLGVRPADRSS
jgi:spermidine synthase